jgi:UDP:flavonoid glycosyltransferase YjiC (YdhE family)
VARVVVYSIAYRGDVLPYAPIAAELARRGHDVTFVAPEELHPVLAAPGVRLADADAGEMTPSGLDAYGDYCARWGTIASGAMLMNLYYRRLTVPRVDALVAAVDAVADGAELLVSHPGAAPVASIPFERRGIPWIVGDLFPMLTPTETRLPEGVLPFDLGSSRVARSVARGTWRIADSPPARWLLAERELRAARTRFGLPTDGWHVMDHRLSPHGNLVLVSPQYFPPAHDWGDDYPFVGFTPWTTAGDPLPADVGDYLAAGEPPVLVCLGTSAASAAPQVFDATAEALDSLGLRGLYLASNASVARRLGTRAGVWPFVPVGPVLPHVRGVVQAGAHGMSSLVLGAGKPSTIAPVLFDQRWHAERQVELGTGAHVRGRVTVAKLRTAITTMLDPVTTERARAFGGRLAAEDGVGTACDVIETHLAR